MNFNPTVSGNSIPVVPSTPTVSNASDPVVELILFISSFSTASIDTLRDIDRLKIPLANLKIVKADSNDIRDVLLKGKAFQIKWVPTLVVERRSGTIGMYIGKDKIVPWLCALTNTPYAPVMPEPIIVPSYTPIETIPSDDTYSEPPEKVYSAPKRGMVPSSINPKGKKSRPVTDMSENTERKSSKKKSKPKSGNLSLFPETKAEQPMKKVVEEAERMRKRRAEEMGEEDS